MERILTNTIGESIYLLPTFNKDIIMTLYDDKSFEGANVTLTKEQAKELINKLQLLVYGGDVE